MEDRDTTDDDAAAADVQQATRPAHRGRVRSILRASIQRVRGFPWSIQVAGLLVSVLGLIAAVTFGIHAWPRSAAEAAAAPTRVITYWPDSAQPGGDRLPATCSTKSPVSPRATARSCIQAGLVFDPCFITLNDPNAVDCPVDPDSPTSTWRLNVVSWQVIPDNPALFDRAPQPLDQVVAEDVPWAVKVEDRAGWCKLRYWTATGPTTDFGTRTYFCQAEGNHDMVWIPDPSEFFADPSKRQALSMRVKDSAEVVWITALARPQQGQTTWTGQESVVGQGSGHQVQVTDVAF